MIMFMILMLTIVVLMVITVTALATGGAAFIIIFGDVIVCMVFIAMIMKRLFRLRKK